MEQPVSRRRIARLGSIGAGAAVVGIAGPRIGRGQDSATPATPEEDMDMTQPTVEQLREMWGRWSDLWNGDLAVADEIIAPGFVAHFAPASNSPSEVRGPDGLAAWIDQIMSVYTGYSVATTVGPVTEADMLAGRWVIRGTYQGGIPGSRPEAVGKDIAFEGMDLLRVDGDQIAEYWVSSDTLSLLQQIGVIPS